MAKKAKAIHPVSLLIVGSLHIVMVCHLKNNHLSCQVLFGCVMFRPICYSHVMVRVRSGGAMSMSDKSIFSSSLQSFILVTIYLYGWMDGWMDGSLWSHSQWGCSASVNLNHGQIFCWKLYRVAANSPPFSETDLLRRRTNRSRWEKQHRLPRGNWQSLRDSNLSAIRREQNFWKSFFQLEL